MLSNKMQYILIKKLIAPKGSIDHENKEMMLGNYIMCKASLKGLKVDVMNHLQTE